MDAFEYTMLVWPAGADGSGLIRELDQLGAQGWEAVGMTTRSVATPRPGMGAKAESDVVVLLKRHRVT
jgi:hypothetical protein